jgi:predicted PurR-regulated permease PerM
MTDEPGSSPSGASSGEQPAAPLPVSARSVVLTIIATVVVLYFVHWARELLIPVVLAILTAFILTPFVNLLSRAYFPRALASALVIALFGAAVGAGIWAISDDAIKVVEDLPEATQRMRGSLQRRSDNADSALEKVQRAATEIEKTAEEAAPTPPTRPRAGVQRVQIVEPAFKANDYLWIGGLGLAGLFGQILMILFLTYFLLASGDLYKRKLVKIAGPTLSRRRITLQILDNISAQIGRFLLALLLANLIVAASTAALLWWLDVEGWLFWGIAAGVFNTIPYFGPIIISVALAVVAFLQFGELGTTALVVGGAFAITSLEGWLLTPALMGRAASMNPAAVFVGLLLWGWLWGLWGIVLAVPMMVLFKAACDHVEDLQPIGELLGE